MKLEAGEKAPTFKLKAPDGETVTPSSLKGAPFVLYFYPKDDTPGCTVEAVDFTALKDEFAALGCRVLGVSRDDAAAHLRFSEKHNLGITLLSDPDLKAHKAFGAWGEKNMYGKKTEGVIRSTFLVDAKGKIARAWYSVKAKGHAAKVLETVRSHLAEAA